jgi:hypothetical protein
MYQIAETGKEPAELLELLLFDVDVFGSPGITPPRTAI